MSAVHTLPIEAQDIIGRIAIEHGVTSEEIMRPTPPGRPAFDQMRLNTIRSLAIQALANETYGPRMRWSVQQIAKWFGVSRTTIITRRAELDGYVARRTAKA